MEKLKEIENLESVEKTQEALKMSIEVLESHNDALQNHAKSILRTIKTSNENFIILDEQVKSLSASNKRLWFFLAIAQVAILYLFFKGA